MNETGKGVKNITAMTGGPPAVRRKSAAKACTGGCPCTSPERGDFLQVRLCPVNSCSITQIGALSSKKLSSPPPFSNWKSTSSWPTVVKLNLAASNVEAHDPHRIL
jgi:hypothetical protein